MVCPFCGSIRTSVRNSRHTSRRNQVWRRRHCEECGRTFTTREKIELEFLEVSRKNGSSEPFLRSKLVTAVIEACSHQESAVENAFALVETIEIGLLRELPEGGSTLPTKLIFKNTSAVLKRYDAVAYLKYVAHYGSKALGRRDIKKALSNAN